MSCSTGIMYFLCARNVVYVLFPNWVSYYGSLAFPVFKVHLGGFVAGVYFGKYFI